MNYFSHLHTAAAIIAKYQGRQPFHNYIKEFFRQDKKYGSKDRKSIAHLCYCYFRGGRAFAHAGPEERIISALFLCSPTPNPTLEQLKPEWNALADAGIAEKMRVSGADAALVFPWLDQLAAGIDKESFALSHLVQPDLFLRLRPGQEQKVKRQLTAAGIPFSAIGATCLALPNASKLELALTPDKEAVIQDYNSQRVGAFLEDLKDKNSHLPLHVWDCCAASGGKSIMAKDILGDMDLTVSDSRSSILANLEKRFAVAGIRNYRRFSADLAEPKSPIPHSSFELIIADVPCTGSGTWARTPERLLFFDEAEISRFSGLQRKITGNIIPSLRKGGHLLYITCSVFEEENGAVVDFIQATGKLRLVRSTLLEGYNVKADTLFAALFTTA